MVCDFFPYRFDEVLMGRMNYFWPFRPTRRKAVTDIVTRNKGTAGGRAREARRADGEDCRARDRLLPAAARAHRGAGRTRWRC